MCEAKFLDVKGTEQDSPLLWGWLPFWPDIKKKARIEIQQGERLRGTPADRRPRPEAGQRRGDLDRRDDDEHPVDARRHPRREVVQGDLRAPRQPGCLGIPTGLGHWTTEDVYS